MTLHFLIFEKGGKQKIGPGFFLIFKYTFSIYLKSGSAKNWARFFLRFGSTLFLIFEKGISKRLCVFFFKIYKYTFD